MTTWVEEPHGGRDRGPRALVRAWTEVLVRPRRFFRNGVAPGDQAPGLTFAISIALVYLGERLVFVPDSLPNLGVGTVLSTVLLFLLVGLVIAPATLHLTSALQTVLLILFVRERGGISQTVQVLAYASAPCALAGIPVPALRVVCAGYGAVLLVVGLAEVHDTSLPRAIVAGAIPAAVLFGYVFGGFAAGEAVVASLGLLEVV